MTASDHLKHRTGSLGGDQDERNNVNESKPAIPDDLSGLYAQAGRDSGQYYAHLTQGLIERIGVREQELLMVDEALARRPAVADAPNRYTAICAAFNMASRTDKAEAMEKHWKFHYEKTEVALAQKTRECEDVIEQRRLVLNKVAGLEAQVEQLGRQVAEMTLLLTNCRNGLELILGEHEPASDDPFDTINELRETVRKSTEALNALASRARTK